MTSSSFCATDGLALAMIVGGIAAGRDLSRLEDRVLVVILAIAWVGAAARRLADFRQGHCRAVTLDRRSSVSTLCMLAFGTAPWFAVEPLQYVFPDAAIWTRLDVPPVLKVVGIVMAVTTLGGPFIRRSMKDLLEKRNRSAAHFTVDSAFLTTAVFLLTGSPLIGVFSGAWFAVALHPSTSLFGSLRQLDPVVSPAPLAVGPIGPEESGAFSA